MADTDTNANKEAEAEAEALAAKDGGGEEWGGIRFGSGVPHVSGGKTYVCSAVESK